MSNNSNVWLNVKHQHLLTIAACLKILLQFCSIVHVRTSSNHILDSTTFFLKITFLYWYLRCCVTIKTPLKRDDVTCYKMLQRTSITVTSLLRKCSYSSVLNCSVYCCWVGLYLKILIVRY